MKLTLPEWDVMEVLWSGESFTLGEITSALKGSHGWTNNTVHTYLTRMCKKGLVIIHKDAMSPYKAAVSKEDCARQERDELLNKVYSGSAGELIAAFLKDSEISKSEVERLKKMLDEMEV